MNKLAETLITQIMDNPHELISNTDIENFIMDETANICEIFQLKESNLSTGISTDDGPSVYYRNMNSYKSSSANAAEKLGMTVLDYLVKDDKMNKTFRIYPTGPVDSVSFAPAGVGTGQTPNNQTDLVGKELWDAYMKHIRTVSQQVGYKLIDYLGKDSKNHILNMVYKTEREQKELENLWSDLNENKIKGQ
jgi:hypothetical protein